MITPDSLEYYKAMLRTIGSLTGLFSENKVPYLHYRIAENLFCKAFSARNLSRSDVSADATLNGVGFGIKTFLHGNGKSFQKIAEFNRENVGFRTLAPVEAIQKIARLRNERIEATKRIYLLHTMKYHCIVRDAKSIFVYECDMDLIDVSTIKNIVVNNNVIGFSDAKNDYSFNISKSTLYQRFITKNVLAKVEVRILDDPFEIIQEKFLQVKDASYARATSTLPFVILPLYSTARGRNIVHPKSGLNQWNAGGRKRDANEIYIPIPKWIHEKYPGFFLSRKEPFELILPDGTLLRAKVCQDGDKALMSAHNADLGKWLLRDVLNLKTHELLTYEKLQEIGLDSVIIERVGEKKYSITFRALGTYEDFVAENA